MELSEAVKVGMRETNERFCKEVRTGGAIEVLDQVYTAEAKLLPPGAEMVTGREAIKGFWQKVVEALGIKGVTLETVTAEMCGDTVIEIGRAGLELKDGQTVRGKYIVHWKQEDGNWRWDKDIWNVD